MYAHTGTHAVRIALVHTDALICKHIHARAHTHVHTVGSAALRFQFSFAGINRALCRTAHFLHNTRTLFSSFPDPPPHTYSAVKTTAPACGSLDEEQGGQGLEEPPEGESEAAAQGWGAGPGGQDKTGAEDEDARAAAGHFLGGSWRCGPELTGNAGGNAPNSTAGWQWGGRTKEGPPGFRRHHLGDPIQQVRLS